MSQSNQSFANLHNTKQVEQYTYFDSIIKRYTQMKKKNHQKYQQNKQKQQLKQLTKCTFKPLLISNDYYRKHKKVDNQWLSNKNYHKKQHPYERLLKWGHNHEIKHRNHIIKNQIETTPTFTRSIQKIKPKSNINQKTSQLNRSYEDTFRSSQNSQEMSKSLTNSINAIPLDKNEIQGEKSYYKTFQLSKHMKDTAKWSNKP